MLIFLDNLASRVGIAPRIDPVMHHPGYSGLAFQRLATGLEVDRCCYTEQGFDHLLTPIVLILQRRLDIHRYCIDAFVQTLIGDRDVGLDDVLNFLVVDNRAEVGLFEDFPEFFNLDGA